MLEALVKQSVPLPASSKMLILGGGFSGQRVAALARKLGVQVICSRRDLTKVGADVIFNTNPEILPPLEALENVTHLLSCIPPSETGTDPVLTALLPQLKEMPLQWAGYLSTTGVYGDCQGEWVSEVSSPNPQQPRSQRRFACESAWLSSGLPVQIIRLPGIYGPGRSALESITSGKCTPIHKPGQIFSRIHIDDIAGATFHLIHLAAKGKKPRIVNVADNYPSTNIEVLYYAASLLGVTLPPVEAFAVAEKRMSPMALSFWQENRKVSNKMLCEEMGYSLLHPDYHSGLQDCLQAMGN